MANLKEPAARSYGQYCGLARAWDLVGDRWNLLIVRELLPGPLRFNELTTSLAGIATNLLTERLRALEAGGVVERRLGDRGILYALTPWGAELHTPMEALGRWAAPLLMSGRGADSFQPRWLVLALPALLHDVTCTATTEVGFNVEGLLIVLRIDESGPTAAIDPDQPPTTVLTAGPDVVVGLVAGGLTVEQAVAAGELTGDIEALHAAFTDERRL
ncbi:helix-turn-helix domain-containing protein [Tsukamurella sp. 8F]|uniref:winged helix-turn-helix transcriptional regulator n=1 Tax=unclassified Tsukamurella TaxID=2633480 RepID=UPI0023B8A141|nr:MULTISPECIES: helix-turn-helix domain-containing protein [unclassified Tsukamurella]MDF0531680.1 helix-turn-helix domain-containing protein [Tsukamurella sp. 8J]MDF0588926.1 helix-turn-helix domain-containing protein [Tsukamurella sp. 8F]